MWETLSSLYLLCYCSGSLRTLLFKIWLCLLFTSIWQRAPKKITQLNWGKKIERTVYNNLSSGKKSNKKWQCKNAKSSCFSLERVSGVHALTCLFLISGHWYMQKQVLCKMFKGTLQRFGIGETPKVFLQKEFPLPGLEPGSLGWEPSILTI